jgi:hypothetical protein
MEQVWFATFEEIVANSTIEERWTIRPKEGQLDDKYFEYKKNGKAKFQCEVNRTVDSFIFKVKFNV